MPFSAQELVNDPKRFYTLSKSQSAYLTVLRAIAINLDSLSKVLKTKMKSSPFFLGSRRTPAKENETEDENESAEFDLKIPSDIVIVVRFKVFYIFL